MARLPTVCLKGKDGNVIKVNASNYAANIEGWISKGFELVGEEDRVEAPAVVNSANPGSRPEVDLEAMTKADLVTWAAENLDLILDDAMKKAEMIAAIRERLEEAERA